MYIIKSFIFFLCFFLVKQEATTAQALGSEDLSLDLSIAEVIVNHGNHYPKMGQEIIVSCVQYLTPATNYVDWNSIVGYFFSRKNVFDSTAVLLATDESSLGGRTWDEYDPEIATIDLPDSIVGVVYVYVVSDYPHTFSHLESDLRNNVVKIPLIIQESINGLEDERMDELLTLYPNPASEVLHVKTHGRDREQVFEIYDTSGVMVKRVSSDQGHTSIDVSNLIAGMYFVHIPGVEKFQKLIIIK